MGHFNKGTVLVEKVGILVIKFKKDGILVIKFRKSGILVNAP